MYLIEKKKKKLSGRESHPSPQVSRLVISGSHTDSYMMKKFLKVWDDDKGPHDVEAKFLNPAQRKKKLRE